MCLVRTQAVMSLFDSWSIPYGNQTVEIITMTVTANSNLIYKHFRFYYYCYFNFLIRFDCSFFCNITHASIYIIFIYLSSVSQPKYSHMSLISTQAMSLTWIAVKLPVFM